MQVVIPSDLKPLPTAPYDERPESLPLDIEETRTALWRCRGNITKAAGLLKVPSSRLRAFVANSAYLTREQNESREQLKDVAEDILYEALTDTVDAGRRDTMARFVMTNIGKDRGYGSGGGVSLNLPNKGRMQISWDDGTTLTGEDTVTEKVIEHE